MATDQQIAANRANAQKSTGPRTARGKAAVRLNSVTHGLTAHSILTYGEESELPNLQAVRAALEAEWQPQTVTESLLLDEASACWWRLRRGRAAEDFCAANAVKHLRDVHDDFALINIEMHSRHTPTKMEIVGNAFRDRLTAQQMTRISLYNGRNFRQMFRCFQHIVQLRKAAPIDPAAAPASESTAAPPPQPDLTEPPLKTVDALFHDLAYSPYDEYRRAEFAKRRAAGSESKPAPDPLPPVVYDPDDPDPDVAPELAPAPPDQPEPQPGDSIPPGVAAESRPAPAPVPAPEPGPLSESEPAASAAVRPRCRSIAAPNPTLSRDRVPFGPGAVTEARRRGPERPPHNRPTISIKLRQIGI